MLDKKIVGATIRQLRGDRKQSAVARKAGLDSSTWSQYETGKVLPSEENVTKLAVGLEIPERELRRAIFYSHYLDVDEDPSGGDVGAQVAHRLVSFFESFSQHQRDVLRDCEAVLATLRDLTVEPPAGS